MPSSTAVDAGAHAQSQSRHGSAGSPAADRVPIVGFETKAPSKSVRIDRNVKQLAFAQGRLS
jgi:hypothetical protein